VCTALLVALALFSWPALAAAQAILSRVPTWSSAPAQNTHGVALGDIDRDGDLDLVCANDGQLSAMYRNDGSRLDPIPAWNPDSGPRTTTVVLGDIDLDGGLDALFSGSQGATLFLNDGVAFNTSPAWVSQGASLVSATALGDVDGDGDLDLLCGTTVGRFGLLLNVGGTFDEQTQNPWNADHETGAIELGDVDGDSDLDLVCTDNSSQVRLYANIGGTFATTPAWTSSIPANTAGLALGDMDGDGDLDLVVANNNDVCALWANSGGTFGQQPAWTADVRFEARAVELADVDGDGNLDIAFGVQGQPSLVYLGGPGGLERGPLWQSGPADATVAVAFGDIDGDGDPELVCGNLQQTTTYYQALRIPFDPLPSWDLTTGGNDVALGDVDSDGDLDLVVAGLGPDPDALYRNTDGVLERTTSWMPAGGDNSDGVALGDVNGDGSLDLVCGRSDARNVLYLNTGGMFETTPSWSSADVESTTSVAFADIDGDGDLDVVCGGTGLARAHRNIGGTFEPTPFWTSAMKPPGTGLALGDVDGNRTVDAVVGGALFRNHNMTLDSLPSWTSSPTTPIDPPRDLALGDVDGDGDLDLAIGKGNFSNALYVNNGFTFGPRTEWFPERSDGTRGMAFADFDSDGDLDVVCVGSGPNGRFVVYENVLGRFGAAPLWEWRLSGCNGVVCGDLDADGDLEVAVAGDPGNMVALRGYQRPPTHFDPLAPRNQLPTNPAYLRAVQVSSPNAGQRRITFTAIDVESDSIWVRPEFQRLGSGRWELMQVASRSAAGGVLGPLATSPSGIEHQFDWELTALPIGQIDVAIRLRTVSHAARGGPIQYVAGYYAQAGPIIVRRPAIEATQPDLPIVTVGDTATAFFSIRNGGDETLVVESIDLPEKESMRLDVQPPFDVLPGQIQFLRLDYMPVVETSSSNTMTITSNDPLQPLVPMRLLVVALGLKVRTQALTDVDSVALGQALAIQSIPVGPVAIENAKLFHRPTGGESFTAIPMVRPGGVTDPNSPLFGIIPGDQVTDLGIEYYVELANSDIFATDPPLAPEFGVYHQAVAQPHAVLAVPQPNSTSGFLAGRSVVVQVAIPQGTRFEYGSLHYRQGGASEYAIDSLEVGELIPFATMLDSMVGPRGLEYWVDVQTRTSRITDPPVHPESKPATLRVRVQNVVEPATHPAERYRLLSVPLDFGEFAGTLAALLADEPEFGPYDPTRWRAFLYTAANGNIELADDERFRPAPGRAYWLISRGPHQIDTAPIEGLSTPTGEPQRIVLGRGWNAVGNPFVFPVAWSSVRSSVPLEAPVAFDPRLGTHGDYAAEPASVLAPFEGYFVENPSARPETLYVPPVEMRVRPAASRSHAGTGRPAAVAADRHSWRLQLALRGAAGQDAGNILGVEPTARDEYDALDAREPPAAPGGWVQLCFANDGWDTRPGTYRRDMRAPNDAGHAWDLEVRGATSETLLLEPSTEMPLPPDLALALLDLEQGTRMDLRAPDGSFTPYRVLAPAGGRPYRLRVLAGTADWVERQSLEATGLPERFAAQQNSPNPFHHGTRIRFGLPRATHVTLEIFDVQGRRVATLVNRERLPAGWHVRLWDGSAAGGRAAASGVYFYRLRAGDQVVTKRMVLLQ
jgi:hypothetical protein